MNTLALSSPLFPFRRNLTRKRRGFGLLEVILVFAVVIGAAAVLFTVNQSATLTAGVDHDHQMATTIAANANILFPVNSDASNFASSVSGYYSQNSTRLGGSFCDPAADPTFGVGCWTLNGQPLEITEVDGGGGSPTLDGYGLVWNDLTVGQCVALLSGGPASMGSLGVTTGSLSFSEPQSEAGVISWCNTNSSGGFIDATILYYNSSNAWPFQVQPTT